MNKPQKKGGTLKEQLEQAQKQVKHQIPQLQGPEFPEPLRFLWDAFIEMSSVRPFTEVGVGPITYSEIKAFSELTEHRFSPKDIQILRLLDNTYLRVING